MNDSECPICMEFGTELSTNCGHGFCDTCFEQLMTYSRKCPICRQTVLSVHPYLPSSRDIFIPMDTDAPNHVGITVTTRALGGVRVTRVNRNDAAHRCGIRSGDVIFRINGIPSVSHDEAVFLMNSATQSKTSMYVTVRRRSIYKFRNCLRFKRC